MIPAFKLKKKQYLYAGIAGALVLGLIGLLIWSVDDNVAVEEASSLKESNIITAGQRINPQEVWVERMESENKLTNKKLDALEKLLMSNIKNAAELENKLEHNQQAESGDPLQVAPLPGQAPEVTIPSGVRKIVIKLTSKTLPGEKPIEKSTIENTIPAGAFAKALLLGGVDASTSVAAQSDPQPVLLRLLDHGNLPRKFKSDLKACHVLASSYGDLSSERVYMRLEKLTCTEKLTGEISETQVSGYVVGEDGRAGIRGVVADRAGPLIRNSFIGGFLSGIGQFFGAQEQKSVFPVSPFGQTKALSPQQMATTGAATGASNALEKYADFFIKRAEQLQPVLQVAAGRSVDIIFTQGTKFGATSVKEAIKKIRDRSRRELSQRETIQQLEGGINEE